MLSFLRKNVHKFALFLGCSTYLPHFSPCSRLYFSVDSFFYTLRSGFDPSCSRHDTAFAHRDSLPKNVVT